MDGDTGLRKSQLLGLLNNKTEDTIKAEQLVEEIIFLEEQLKSLKKLPFISVNPKNPAMQKATPASKQYKEFLQQYNNSLRLLLRLTGDMGDADEESPLRKWIKERGELF